MTPHERASATLDAREIARYSRHLVLPEVGMAGQLRLRSASVLVVGAGGLGSPLALYLAAAGVGRLGLVDGDTVDPSNLHRQLLYGTRDIGRAKLAAARERLADTNPHVRIDCHETRLVAANALEILRGYDVVVDGTDNFPTRYLVNDACVALGTPNVHGSVFRFEGQVSVFHPPHGPCYRCLFPQPPPAGSVPNCAEGGVLGVLPGIIGMLQATETIKLILGAGVSLVGRLLLFDALDMRFRELTLARDPACPCCGAAGRPAIVDLAAGCATVAAAEDEIDVRELKQRLAQEHPPVLLDVRTAEEWSICRLHGAQLIPVHELASRFGELPHDQEIVVYCHRGTRSAMAAAALRARGYERVLNLAGGIDAWAATVEPGMPRY